MCHGPWRIKNVIQEIFALTGVVPQSSFCWVPREANGAANSLAKWSLKNRFVNSFNLCNCPPVLVIFQGLRLVNLLSFCF